MNKDIKTFFTDLEAELAGALAAARESTSSPAISKSSLVAVANHLSRLRDFVKAYSFTDEAEEIHFFKNDKPRLLALYFYHEQMFESQVNEPVRAEDTIPYFRRALDTLQEYLSANREFLQYATGGFSHLDDRYFKRGFVPDTDFKTDREFSTGYDEKLARVLAANMMKDHITSVLNSRNADGTTSPLSWTGSKADLIELVYGLETMGTINNGNADIKAIARAFESVFNVSLGNFYRQFLDIRLRKKEKTTFLGSMKERLEKRMNDFS